MAGTLTKHEIVHSLGEDLRAEQESLHRLLAEISEPEWEHNTPADHWSVRDQVAHLAHFDFLARVAISEPQRFIAIRDSIADLQVYVDHIGPANLSRSATDMRDWWARQSASLREAIDGADPQTRVPWFGPDMSLASKITARIMETWAHGQDVVDALGLYRRPSPCLAHIARIGVLTFANSYLVHGMEVPRSDIRVELFESNGSTFTMGPTGATEAVTGPLEDFCLIVTQRRHIDDTSIQTHGAVAAEWMSLAQAFAGPPGPGRKPGQFISHPASEGMSL